MFLNFFIKNFFNTVFMNRIAIVQLNSYQININAQTFCISDVSLFPVDMASDLTYSLNCSKLWILI